MLDSLAGRPLGGAARLPCFIQGRQRIAEARGAAGCLAGRRGRSWALGLLVFMVAVPLLAVVQQATLLVVAGLLGWAVQAAETMLLPALPVDPVYGGAGLRVLGGIKPCGIALSGALGRALHSIAPIVFGPARAAAPDAFVSALFVPGSTVSARTISAVLATTILLLAVRGLGRRLAGVWSGPAILLAQAYLLTDLARGSALTLRELEATGLPFALAALAPVDAAGQRAMLTSQIDHLSDATIGLICGAAVVALCLGAVLLLEAAAVLIRTVVRGHLPRLRLPRWHPTPGLDARAGTIRLARLAAAALVATGILASPLAVVADGQPAVVDTFVAEQFAPTAAETTAASTPSLAPDPTASLGADQQTATPDLASAPAVAMAPAAPEPAQRSVRQGPSAVVLQGGGYRFNLTVDGAPTVIKGMGYNPWYASLPVEERRAKYDRDFAAMQAIGVNTLEGWFQDQFDEVTLEVANEHGIKVIMPFELNQDYDYADPAIRARFRKEITDWVLRYRDNPAVLMWGPGNEVMHRLIFPTAVKGIKDATQEARADAYAAFQVELMDMIHDLDPSHPVVYRDAEDLYFARLREALQRDGKPRPWFIYGMNVYTQRLAEDIDRWPTQGVDAPLLISEFSPGGVGPEERPQMFGWYWQTIRAHPDMVVGGVVYTWATQGPEDLDRVFGLTDADGNPVDGSLAALGRLFGGSQ